MKAPLSIALMITGLASYPASLAAQARFVYANNDLFPGNNVSAFSVDATGNLTEIPNPDGGVHTFRYDSGSCPAWKSGMVQTRVAKEATFVQGRAARHSSIPK